MVRGREIAARRGPPAFVCYRPLLPAPARHLVSPPRLFSPLFCVRPLRYQPLRVIPPRLLPVAPVAFSRASAGASASGFAEGSTHRLLLPAPTCHPAHPLPPLALECNILPHLPRRRGRRGFRGHARQGPDPARPRGAYPATVAGSDHEVATKSQEDARGGSRLPVHRGYPSGRTSSRSLAASPARMREAVTLAPSSRHWR